MVMPAFNEGEVIRRVVTRSHAALRELTAAFEIIVVDDGSSDDTGPILDELADDDVRVIHFDEHRGYGCALQAGIAIAMYPLVAFMDSDDQFDPLDLRNLLALSAQAEMVVGYRAVRSDGALRVLASRGYNFLVSRVLGLAFRDVNCAFKLFQRKALSNLQLSSEGYAIGAEMLARAQRAGYRIREVPVTHHPRRTGRSKVSLYDVPRALAQVLALRRALHANDRTDLRAGVG
jgi:glycosyltransferase involved in cell wall biosynthesis